MKRTIIIFICLVMVFLCSCGNNAKNELATTLSTDNNGVQQSIVSDKTQSTKEYVTVEIKTNPDDPYSYIIKEKYNQTIDYYSKFPEDGFKSEDYYYIYDIDGNGIEELLIGEPYVIGGVQNVERPYEIEVLITEIYTLKDNKAVKLDIMSWWRDESILERSILDNGLIKYVSGSQDLPSYLYVKIFDGKLMFLYNLKNQSDDYYYRYLDPETISEFKSDKTGFNREYELFFKVEEKEITAEEFDRLRAEIEGDAKPVEIKWKNIDEYGR
ncbi:MAG: hypothetical protein IJO36_07220 [Clostridia bacterium]|nr:hypothetical protein [Clostridia bacterium]